MLCGVPVLAANTGGPTETVVEGETGWLRDPEEVDEWTKVMDKVLNTMSKDELAEMSRSGEARVRGNFADTQMAQRLDDIFTQIENPRRRSNWTGLLLFLLAITAALGASLGIAMFPLITITDGLKGGPVVLSVVALVSVGALAILSSSR